MKPTRLHTLAISAALLFTALVWAQDNNSNNRDAGASTVQQVARTTDAVDYRQGSKSEINLQGTDLLPEAKGKAEVETKTGSTHVKVEVEKMRPANTYGLQYLTYVLWAISPEGVPANLGELVLKDDKAELQTATPMQAFALVVSAEPYFAVSQPSEQIVIQNLPGEKAQGWTRTIHVTYQATPGSVYTMQAPALEEPVYGMDKNLPLSLKEARNAARIAKLVQADQYASSSMQRMQQLLDQANDYYQRKQNEKAIATVAREATQAAEAARVSSLKAQHEARLESERQQARQATEQAQAAAAQEAQRAQQAEGARQAAEQQASQAQAAAQQAAAAAQAAQQQIQQQVNAGQQVQAEQQAAAQQAQAQAEQARQQAAEAQQRAQEQERLARESQQQLQQEQAARQQTEQQLQQAQADKEQVRQRLLGQLSQVMETKDSARGLIVNMPDVLFDLNSANLRPEARERLAKVAGIVIAYPDIRIEVDGYTDNTGSLDFNQQLSQQRADSVRNYLTQQGVPNASIQTRGFGPSDPVASNDTPEGRRENRRVNLVVTGESIGQQTGSGQ